MIGRIMKGQTYKRKHGSVVNMKCNWMYVMDGNMTL